MKKIFIIIFINLITGFVQAQLEVKDTLLMAFSDDIFWSASSELEMGSYSDYGKYGSANLSDNDGSTCWAEGCEGNGVNEYIYLTIPENTKSLSIKNGYQKNEEIYFANNRPKKIEFTLYASYEPSGYVTETHTGFFISEPLSTTQAEIQDKTGFQEVKTSINWPEIIEELSHDNTFDKDRFILKIKILDVYPGKKWNDACISDINILSNPYYDISPDDHGLLKITDIETDTLFYDAEYVHQVVELSTDLKWIIFILMPSDIENSRIETIYKLYNTEKEKFIEINDIFEMYGFAKKNGKLYLEGSDKDLNDFSISLDEL